MSHFMNKVLFVDLVWWTSREKHLWPMVVSQRTWKTTDAGTRYMLAFEVRADRIGQSWQQIRMFDETAERVGPSLQQYAPVVLESPYRGGGDIYKRYLERCIADSIARGEAPFASHKMYTTVLDDRVKEDRELGMALGFAWRRSAVRTVVYEDYGVSDGMADGIEDATVMGQEIDRRRIGRLEEE